MLGTFDFGEKSQQSSLGRISTQDDYVGIEGENRFHSFPVVGRHLVSRIAQNRGDVVSETVI